MSGVPEKRTLRVGYLRLADSAPLWVAEEEGLFARHGLEVELVREVSWANLRDRLVVGQLDAAQFLAPLLLMTSFGVGGPRADLLTGLALGQNGNAITLRRALAEAAQVAPGASFADTARGFARLVREGRLAGPPIFATVHLFSSHSFLLRAWLAAGGLDPERDARILVLPPQQMVDSLSRGVIDGYCVGEPWNSLAVVEGVGAIAAFGCDRWPRAPEKVLAVTEAWHRAHPASHFRLRLALLEACLRLADEAYRARFAPRLAACLELPVEAVRPPLTGRLVRFSGAAVEARPHFHLFGRDHVACPWREHAAWLVHQCGRLLGRALPAADAALLVERCYRPDLYREVAARLGLEVPLRGPQVEAT
ncbi:MAG: nitrate transporter NrtC [Porticoccaceae bacterium]|nr:MAG: nitrate transporter NrtC [Porticoccaceae bacterium]